MRVARVHTVLLAVLGGALAAVVWRSSRAPTDHVTLPPSDRAVEILLPNAALLATVDLQALGRTTWGRSTLGRITAFADPPSKSGCVEEQLRQIRRLAFALPFASPQSSGVELGFLAEGSFDAESSIACATTLMKARGGEPAPSRVNDFLVLRDRRGTGELAVKDGGPSILSGGDYFRDLLEREAGNVPSGRGVAERLHLALRSQAGSPPLLLTWILPPGWLERWLSDRELGQSPLGLIRAIVIRGEAERELVIRVQLSAESSEAAERLEPFLGRLTSGAVSFLSGGQAKTPLISRDAEKIELRLTSGGFDLSRIRQALSLVSENMTGPRSHAFDRPNAQQVEPDTERAAGGRAQ